ncbi:hypothetical protein F5877DRAFT_72410 [Lentinula edodes]|nr:hypothetical protein F5877DRAFT_72410 [Lentinula edodes]
MPNPLPLVDTNNISIGKRNVVFFLCFEDGVEWAARLRNPFKQADPGHNTLFFDFTGYSAAEGGLREAQLGVRIRGWPIPDVAALTGGMTEVQILKIQAQMAVVTWQLALKCTFPVIGQLQAQKNEENSYPLGQIIDRHACQLGPFQSSNDYYIARSMMIYNEAKRKGLDHWQESIDSAQLHVSASSLTFDPPVDKGLFP